MLRELKNRNSNKYQSIGVKVLSRKKTKHLSKMSKKRKKINSQKKKKEIFSSCWCL